MDGAFIYNKYVTGKNFIGRKNDVTILSNFLSQGESVALYGSPKSGKTSLIQQALFNMKVSSAIKFQVVEFSLLNIRTVADFCTKFGSSLLKQAFSTPDEFRAATARLLPDTHFVFDEEVFLNTGMILSLNWDIDEKDIKSVFELPYKISENKGVKTFVLFDNFHNVMQTEDGDSVCNALNGILKNVTPEERNRCSFVFMGSQVNAMKDIFEIRKLFYRTVERFDMSMIETKDIIDHFSRGFLSSGKVIDRNLAMGICNLFRNDIWYINHFASICDSLSKGYMTDAILEEALSTMISIHEPRFIATMNDLTTFQVCLLRAILDGHTKFSSAEVIHRYNLNSSANVRRLKDALCKKEIVTFDNEDRATLLDPLFEYWVRNFFFGIRTENR